MTTTRKPVTSSEVSRAAGVSRSAVSRAFTEGASISTKKRAQVLEGRGDPTRLSTNRALAILHLPFLVDDAIADSLLVDVDADIVSGSFVWKLRESRE